MATEGSRSLLAAGRLGQARLEPGEIVLVKIRECQPMLDDDKARPGVLIRERDGRGWNVMGLTTLQRYANGIPRVECPEQDNPLFGPGRSWLWGPNPPIVPSSSILGHIGWANDALVDVIADLINEPVFRLDDMRPHARRDRKRRSNR